jgi:flagellar motor switch protein FliN/FliY
MLDSHKDKTMTTPSAPYDWVREIKPELKKLDTIPLTGATPPFPWDQLATQIGHSFEREGLTIQPSTLNWRAKEELYEGLGNTSFPLTFSIPMLKGQVCWVMPAQEIAILETWFLTKETHPISFQDETLTESFYRFLTLEVLYQLTQIPFDSRLTPILTNQTTPPAEDSLCWDISLHFQEQTIGGRLIISPEFHRSWLDYFSNQQEPSVLTQEMAQLVDVLLHVEAGKTHLSLEEWSHVQLGDFLILDSFSLDPERLDGRVMLTLNGRRAFRAKLKDGNLKILELPLFHEVESPMTKQPEDDELSDLNFSEDEDLEEDFAAFEDDEDLFEETPLAKEEETPLEDQERIPETTTESPAQSDSSPISPDQIPVALTVEVGRIQMTMDQLLRLEPGNLLELNIHPEQGVDLTIHEKVVGKGELIRLGDVLGVRILQLGRKL